MKLRGFFAAVLVTVLSAPSFAGDAQEIEKLRQHVLTHTTKYYRESFGKRRFENSVQIHVGRLDPRLRLAKCDNNLAFKIQEAPLNIHNITVRTSCEGPRRWTVYVPVTIDIYADILVSTRALQRGDIISEQDLDYRRINIASMGHGHVEDFSRVKGMQLKRPLKPGDALRMAHLVKPKLVRKGQTVVVSSHSRFLSVETAGVALDNGHLGQNIKVKNSRSNRVVEAKVVAPGKVIIATR